ncbi:sulfatase-like hydrolase/transferase [Haladaptatus sp. CMSO5]|uniref:sulfatase-like hydrolase/transferase n=1 Tax=Haladaptatus sp. CMSO5 TaxID=3120514 RepID=UPI002FCDF105
MRNVLLVTIDSLRADHVGHLGYHRDTTPTIDSIANTSLTFSNAFAHACSTRPSFPTILTSVYPLMYGGFERISKEQTVLAEPFSDAEYETAGFHSNLYLSADFGYDAGFDTFFDSKSDPTRLAKIRQQVKRRLDSSSPIYQAIFKLYKLFESKAGTDLGATYVDATKTTDLAIDWIRQRSSEQPKFLWVHYMDVHHPYVPPAKHQRTFRDEPISEREAIQLRRKMLESPTEITETELAKLIDLYDAEIRYTDAEISRLVETVTSEWGETITAITADHGEEFLEHGGFSHTSTFHDEVVHVPFVLDVGVKAGVYEELVGLLDIAPTLLEYANIAIPDSYEGHSLQRLIKDDEWNRVSILGDWANRDSGETVFSYRDTTWKYILTNDVAKLYDLNTDPDEQQNVAKTYPDIILELQQKINAHKKHLESTATDIESVEMEESVKQRLRNLGYHE